MEKINLTIIDPTGKIQISAEIPQDAVVSNVIESIIAYVKLPIQGYRGQIIKYRLALIDGQELRIMDPESTLMDNDVQNESILRLFAEVYEGNYLSEVREFHNIHERKIIEFENTMKGIVFYRIPQYGLFSINSNYQLNVSGNQMVGIYHNGIQLDVFETGNYILNSDNLPITEKYFGKKISEETSFSLEFYFVSTNEYRLLWGTPQPLFTGNRLTNMAFLQMFGNIHIQISDEKKFLNNFGKDKYCRIRTVDNYVRDTLLCSLTQVLGDYSYKDQWSALEIINKIEIVSKRVLGKTRKYLKEIGVSVKRFQIVNLRPAHDSEHIIKTGVVFAGQEMNKEEIDKSEKIIFEVDGGDVNLGDKYTTGQAGVVGPSGYAHDMTFNQSWDQLFGDIKQDDLVNELTQLRLALKETATEPEHDVSIAEVAKAEIASVKGDGPIVLQHLKNAGKWVFDVALDIGVEIAAEAIKRSITI